MILIYLFSTFNNQMSAKQLSSKGKQLTFSLALIRYGSTRNSGSRGVTNISLPSWKKESELRQLYSSLVIIQLLTSGTRCICKLTYQNLLKHASLHSMAALRSQIVESNKQLSPFTSPTLYARNNTAICNPLLFWK